MQKCKMVTAWETTYTEKKECETQNKDECLTVPVEKTRVEENPTEVCKACEAEECRPFVTRTCQKCRREIEEQCEEKTINKCDEVPREVCEDKVTNVTSYETVPVCKKVRDI